MAENKNVNMKPIHNPELDAAIQALKSGSTPEKQQALLNALKSARLLSPCDFDVNVKPDKNGEIKNVHPNQIKFYLLNTNDGKTLFPVFTDIPRTRKINLGDKIDPKYVVRQVKEFDPLLTMPDSKAVGLVVKGVLYAQALDALLVDLVVALGDDLGLHALFVGGDGDGGSVLVRTAHHPDLVPQQDVVPAEDVRGEERTCHVAEVDGAVGVGPGDVDQNL